MQIWIVFCLLVAYGVQAATKNKPHHHQGVLEPYDGKPLPLNLTPDQKNKLNKGESVMYNERTGKSGRGVVIQDINATTNICMSKIRDLGMYNKMVPHVKKVEIYESMKFMNGTSKTGAKFDIGLLGMGFSYYLKLTHEPKHNTLTWTLDYKHSSDLDDSVGHWQVMNHPSKSGWTRLLYSTKIKVMPWIPEFIIGFLTSKALAESTAWVKRESELEAKKQAELQGNSSHPKLPSWMNLKGGASLKEKFERLSNQINQQKKQGGWHGLAKFHFFKK